MMRSVPGLLLAAILALAAWLVSDVFGGSALLYAVLLGLLANPWLSSKGSLKAPWQTGAGLAANQLLKLGVALLGARITLEQLLALGWKPLLIVLVAVPITILSGVLGARLMGERRDLGVITGGAVAICGASAALAIAAVLNRDDHNRRALALTIIMVTGLSLVAMVLYPLMANLMGLSTAETGLLMGGSIHNVPQAVAAGFVVSPQAGETATFIKLLRVAMLVPVVLILSLLLRSQQVGDGEQRQALLPWFLIAFVVLVGMNSLGILSRGVSGVIETVSDALLLLAMAAIGMQSSLADVFRGGWRPLMLLIGETLVLLGMVLILLFV